MADTAIMTAKAALISFANDPEAVQKARSAALATFADFPLQGRNYLVWTLLRWSGWGGAYLDDGEALYRSLRLSGVRELDAERYSPEAGDLFWVPDSAAVGIVAKGSAGIDGRFRVVDWMCNESSRYSEKSFLGANYWLRLPG